MRTIAAPLALIAAGFAVTALACSSSAKRTTFDTSANTPDGGAAPTFSDGKSSCARLECKVPTCEGGATTTLTGKVYDPAGANPLYNVLVYIPDGIDGDVDLPPIASTLTDGVKCETCASTAVAPLVSNMTNEKGEFTLKNVPLDKDVPVVVQLGKWRRKLKIDVTKGCEENKVPDQQFRLPKNGSEGDMPHVAVTAGGADALECLLHGIGIDDSEFVPGASPTGHIHMFNGKGGTFPGAPEAGGTTASRFGGELWNDKAKLSQFDMVMLSCEGTPDNFENKGGAPGQPGARQAMYEYAQAGGKVFATHYHYVWFKNSPQADFRSVATWGSSDPSSDGPHEVVQTLSSDPSKPFPKGVAFAQWLYATGASSTLGELPLVDTRDSVSAVQGSSQAWVQTKGLSGAPTPRYFSFNTPLAAAQENQCGRAVFSDIHVSNSDSSGTFPAKCPVPGKLSAQQKALEFMFFDLSSCVTSDSTPPPGPN